MLTTVAQRDPEIRAAGSPSLWGRAPAISGYSIAGIALKAGLVSDCHGLLARITVHDPGGIEDGVLVNRVSLTMGLKVTVP
jgi:hypothetical protein